jgi:hypothetical protein
MPSCHQCCVVGDAPAVAALLAFALASAASAQEGRPELAIPRLQTPPAIEDFLTMEPATDTARAMAVVEGFLQTTPSDGQPATQSTRVYAGYDADSLYFVFVAFDDGPVRATMARRDLIDNSEDWIEVAIDTFDDRRRAYLFDTNAIGLQWDALHSEATGESPQFDEVWYSRGRLTDRGFVAWVRIPFKSLRFPDTPTQTWGIQFRRWVARLPELTAWPHESTRITGRLSETARLTGLDQVSPGRNLQLIPYGTFRAFRALDLGAADGPRFVSDAADTDLGVDAKIVLQDRLALDLTLNPDFNQVESDTPQVTVNQRFEVFFPEKRPFFLENADVFQSPMNLLFTRRIADPQLGARLSGKIGRWGVGGLLIDDEAPGRRVSPDSPLSGSRARFGIVRVQGDVGDQSTVGAIFTSREFEGSFNRVGGMDARLRLGRSWTTTLQAVSSATRHLDGTTASGPAYVARVDRRGRQFNATLRYDDLGEGFLTQSGFVNRTGFRRLLHAGSFEFRPEGRRLIAWGPTWTIDRTWDRDGTRLDALVRPGLAVELVGQTRAEISAGAGRERLRPRDFAGLPASRDFDTSPVTVELRSSVLDNVTVDAEVSWGAAVNLVPPPGADPAAAERFDVELLVVARPVRALRVQHAYLHARLADRDSGRRLFTNQILRSSWSWQFTQALSLRAILQYDTLRADRALTRLETTRNVNADLLVAYQLNPWTALYVGGNTNFQNLGLLAAAPGGRPDLVRTSGALANDGRQIFVKLSYLIRY